MSIVKRTAFLSLAAALAAALPRISMAEQTAPPDLLSFAQGVLPLAVTEGAEPYRIGAEQAISAIDGNPQGYVLLRKPAPPEGTVEFLYELPAPTVFTALSVPNVTETPSPSQTFFREVTVLGSADGPGGTFVPLASGTLTTHAEPDHSTALTMADAPPPVSWVRLRLSGGIDVQVDASFFEFSEIVGTGTQEAAPLSQGFTGVWSGRGVKLELEQTGATVKGCYDGNARLTGTVDGNVLRALGQNDAGIPSQFILIATADGAMRGLRSSNGAPFKPYDGEASGKAPTCLAPEPPRLGCGSVIHGIQFDYDSAAIRPASAAVLADLSAGLAAESVASIQIIGHSSSEGADDYNRDLSERRARSVVEALAGLGVDASRMSAAGKGEAEPIASNADEAGRSLNRRVEVRCAG